MVMHTVFHISTLPRTSKRPEMNAGGLRSVYAEQDREDDRLGRIARRLEVVLACDPVYRIQVEVYPQGGLIYVCNVVTRVVAVELFPSEAEHLFDVGLVRIQRRLA